MYDFAELKFTFLYKILKKLPVKNVRISPTEPMSIISYFGGHFPVISKEDRSLTKKEFVEHTTHAEFNSVNGTFYIYIKSIKLNFSDKLY